LAIEPFAISQASAAAAGLGILAPGHHRPLAPPDLRGRYAQLIGKITMPGLLVDKSIEICSIMPSTRPYGYKRGNLSGLNSVRGLLKTIFAMRWANPVGKIRLNFPFFKKFTQNT
jgi:hypothetical protein